MMMIVEIVPWKMSVWNVIFEEKEIKLISRFHYFLMTKDVRTISNFYIFVSFFDKTDSSCFVSKTDFCHVPLSHAKQQKIGQVCQCM